jgi:hypothetical protein
MTNAPSHPLAGRTFTIDITMWKFAHCYSRSSVVLLTGDPKRPYLVLARR